MNLIIVTPQGTALNSNEVTRINLPTQAGEIGIMDNHEPLIANIVAGEVEIILQSGDQEEMAISRGILQVEPGNVVRILADTAELAAEIDHDRAALARQRAEEFLAKAEADETDFAQVEYLQAKLAKELARESLSKKYRA